MEVCSEGPLIRPCSEYVTQRSTKDKVSGFENNGNGRSSYFGEMFCCVLCSSLYLPRVRSVFNTGATLSKNNCSRFSFKCIYKTRFAGMVHNHRSYVVDTLSRLRDRHMSCVPRNEHVKRVNQTDRPRN